MPAAVGVRILEPAAARLSRAAGGRRLGPRRRCRAALTGFLAVAPARDVARGDALPQPRRASRSSAAAGRRWWRRSPGHWSSTTASSRRCTPSTSPGLRRASRWPSRSPRSRSPPSSTPPPGAASRPGRARPRPPPSRCSTAGARRGVRRTPAAGAGRETFGAETAELVTEEPGSRPDAVVPRRRRWLVLRGASSARASGRSRRRSPPTSASCASGRSWPARAWPRAARGRQPHPDRAARRGLPRPPYAAGRAALGRARRCACTTTRLDATSGGAARRDGGVHRPADRMVSDLLDMSRLQTGAVTPIAADVPLGRWSDRALAGLAARSGWRSASSRRRTSTPGCSSGSWPTSSPTPCATATAGRGRGRERTGARVELRVVDHGPGVPAEDRARIFEPFQRPGTTPAPASGSGWRSRAG